MCCGLHMATELMCVCLRQNRHTYIFPAIHLCVCMDIDYKTCFCCPPDSSDSGAATETWWYISYEMPHLKFILVTCTTFHILPFFSFLGTRDYMYGRKNGRAGGHSVKRKRKHQAALNGRNSQTNKNHREKINALPVTNLDILFVLSCVIIERLQTEIGNRTDWLPVIMEKY